MADLRVQYDEEVVGAGHPTKDDTLNRLTLAQHENDGSHNESALASLVGAGFRGFLSGLTPVWKDADEITFRAGAIEIDGSMYTLAASTDVQFTGLGTSEWRYIYVSAPGSGYALSSSEFSSDTTPPTWDATRKGWYNASGTGRCIGVFNVDGSGNIHQFTVSGGWYYYKEAQEILNTSSPATSLTSLSAGVPNLGSFAVQLTAHVTPAAASDTPSIYVTSGNAVSATGQRFVGESINSQLGGSLGIRMTDSNGQIKYSSTASQTVKLYVLGFALLGGMSV